MSVPRALLVVDHGSRVAVANESVGAVADLLRARGEYDIVLGAHMELAAPDVATALNEVVQQGAMDITVVPFMLAPGRHATEDIPRLVADAAREHVGVTWRVTAPLGVHDLLAQLVLERAREAQPPHGRS